MSHRTAGASGSQYESSDKNRCCFMFTQSPRFTNILISMLRKKTSLVAIIHLVKSTPSFPNQRFHNLEFGS